MLRRQRHQDHPRAEDRGRLQRPVRARPAIPSRYYLIEVNPRVSRSSALASKATGYPIARVTAKIAVGMTLDEISTRQHHGQPSSRRWTTWSPRCRASPSTSSPTATNVLGTQMKATGEVMGIGRTSGGEPAQGRPLSGDRRAATSTMPKFDNMTTEELLDYISIGSRDDRIFAIARADLRWASSVEKICRCNQPSTLLFPRDAIKQHRRHGARR